MLRIPRQARLKLNGNLLESVQRAHRGAAPGVELRADERVAHDARRVRGLLRRGLYGVVAGLQDLVGRDGVRIGRHGLVVALLRAVDGLPHDAQCVGVQAEVRVYVSSSCTQHQPSSPALRVAATAGTVTNLLDCM